MILRCRDREITFPRKPMVMSIVNVNDDSFSGDGTLDISEAIDQASDHLAAGADIIDVGAESARTNREAISIDEEISRLESFVSAFRNEHPEALLSANTWRPEVVEAILPLGVDILNDIGGLPDDRNARLCAEHRTALLIMHSVGLPKVAHTSESYGDVMAAIEAFFEEKIALAQSAGLAEEQLLLDPGIDFAKQRDDNLRIFRELERLARFNRPVLLPVSRKTMIGEVLGIEDPSARDAGTVACITSGVIRGADILRVHNTEAAVQSISVLHALR